MGHSSIEWVSLGDLMDAGAIQVTTGFPFGGHNEIGKGVPHIRPFNVGTDGDIYLNQIKSIPAAAAVGKPQLQPRDIVFNNTNTKELVGKCALWSSDSLPVFSNHMTRVRVAEGALDPTYLSFAILHHWLTGKSEMLARSHVAQASIIGARFREIEVPRLPFAEQRTISKLIEQVRRGSRSETAQIECAQELKQAAMRELFTRGLRGEVQKDSEIGLVPESWVVVPFDEALKIAQGQVDPKVEPYASMFYIGPENVESHSGHLLQCKRAKDLGLISGKYFFANGDIVYSKIRPYLNKVVMPEFEGICSADMYPLRACEGFNARFLFHYLLSDFFLRQAVPHQLRTGIPKINREQLSDTAFPRPSADEQREIVTILDAIDRKIALHRQKRIVLEELFQSLLHKLMTGEIRVADLDLSALQAANPGANP